MSSGYGKGFEASRAGTRSVIAGNRCGPSSQRAGRISGAENFVRRLKRAFSAVSADRRHPTSRPNRSSLAFTLQEDRKA